MVKWTWSSWRRDTSGWGVWLSYYAALLFGMVIPFVLYLISSITYVEMDPTAGSDTTVVPIWPVVVAIIAFLSAALIFACMQTPNRALLFQKLKIALWDGRGLTIPLALAGFIFYVPLLVLAGYNNLVFPLGDNYSVVTPLIQSSYSVHLVVLSVAAIVRYFFVTAAVQTGISGFSRNLTGDLERLASKGKGFLAVSLPWLAFGKLTLDPDVFEDFRSALEKCLQRDGIRVEVFTLPWSTLRAGARKAKKSPERKVDVTSLDKALDCEKQIRKLVKNPKMVTQAQLLGCVIVNEKLYAVHTLLHKAQENAHLGDAFISMEIDNENISKEYKRRLETIAQIISAKAVPAA